jgi:molybdenum cofactor synthesis domain-containing protein
MAEVTVITVSDRAAAGIYADRSGPALVEALKEHGYNPAYRLVPDNVELIRTAILSFSGSDWIILTGGTGVGSRDCTPETVAKLCDKALPGLDEYIRRESLKETPFAVFSRGYSGIRGKTFIVSLPGSEKAARLAGRLLPPLMTHGSAMINDGHHS